MNKYIQVGIIASRDPVTGEFLSAQPIYREMTPELKEDEETMIRDIGKLFAQKMKQYRDSQSQKGV